MIKGFTGPTQPVEFEGVTFQVDAAGPDRPAWFALGIRKSGSSMFNRAVNMMARFNELNWIDIPGDLFEHDVPGHRWRDKDLPPALIVGGNVYGGFRDFPIGLRRVSTFQRACKVLLVRDPRDAIVSEYFSTARTHSLPAAAAAGGDEGATEEMLRKREAAQQMSVDDYVIAEGAKLADTIRRYIPLRDDPQLLLLRYEDVVFDKAAMIRAVTGHFGWRIEPQQIDAILKWIDVRPEAEDATKFIRKVTPGDHLEKLSAPVIARLNGILGDGMAAFGYR